MTRDPLFDKIDARVTLDLEEGDIAYFHALSLKLEYVTKVVVAGVVSCIGEDTDRHRFTLEHELVRANSLGDWVAALNKALTGPPAHFVDPNARTIARDLTERVGSDDWRYSAVCSLDQAAKELGIHTELGAKVALRQFFDIGARIAQARFKGVPRYVTDKPGR